MKAPRYYIRDSGITHRLLDISNYDNLLSNPVLGKSWEDFVIENIHSVMSKRAETYFYRTMAGGEIDLVIKLPSGDIWCVEIKYGIAPKISKYFARICEDINAKKQYIIYGGDDEFPIRDDICVISLAKFMLRVII